MNKCLINCQSNVRVALNYRPSIFTFLVIEKICAVLNDNYDTGEVLNDARAYKWIKWINYY